MTYYLDSEKIWQLVETDQTASQNLAKELGITGLTSVLLTNRGLNTVHDANAFLNPSSKLLSEPASMPGMEIAVTRIKKAIKEDELIYIHGDYDVDGVTSTTLLYEALLKLKAKVRYHIPCRFKDGYGLKKATIDKFSKEGAKLLITVDCGIKNFSEVIYARRKGLGVIITDHHEPGEKIPDADVVLNPKLENYSQDSAHLAGVGVALKLAQALCDDPLEEYFDLVAMGTIADIAPLINENRYLTKSGLNLLNKNQRLGVAKLANCAGIKDQQISTYQVGYVLGPRINAGGRMAKADICVELLSTKDEDRAAAIAAQLQEANAKRQNLERTMLDEALKRVEEEVDLEKEKVIFLADEKWHDGIKGIIASRIKERFFRPAFIGTIKRGKVQASGRSIPNFSLNRALENCSDLLSEYGGHDKACGVTVEKENLAGFKHKLNDLAGQWLAEEDLHPKIRVDAITNLDSFNTRFETELQEMEPFGEANAKPCVILEDVYLKNQKRLGEKGNHMKFDLFKDDKQLAAIGFKMDAFSAVINHQGKADLVIQPEFNSYRGRITFRANVIDIKLKALSLGDPKSIVEHLFANKDALAAREEYKNIGDNDSFYTKIVGVTFDDRQYLIERLNAGTPLRLKREPENSHDPNAIRVLSSSGDDLGFLNKKLAKQLAPLMDTGILFDCRVTDVTGGEEEKNRGVNVVVERYQTANELEPGQTKKVSFKDEKEALEAIRETILGSNQYHQYQKEAIKSLQDNQNTLAIMGTGRGKSAIFQTIAAQRALAQNKLAIFLYPLRSLITDQFLFLKEAFLKLGLNVAKISGDCSINERQKVFEAMSNGCVDIALTTPEFLHHNIGSFSSIKERIGFLVVDEAHHLSTSNQAHRPLYGKVNKLIPALGNPLVMAATATANEATSKAIIEKLLIQKTIVDPTIRENLRIADKREISNKDVYIKELIESGKKVLVYVNSREKAAELANILRCLASDYKDKIVYYHAGLSNKLRLAVQEGYTASTFTTVVATSAFGEGVDIGDIRHLVLYHLPFSFIEYNQQSGRCGRDGQEACIHTLFGQEDARINELILDSKGPGRKTLTDIWRTLVSLVNRQNMLTTTVAEIAAQVNLLNPASSCNHQTVASSLKIFSELDLIERVRSPECGVGSGRLDDKNNHTGVPAFVLRRNIKADLNDSVIFEEGVHEKQQFNEFKDWAFSVREEELLNMINKPIRPEGSQKSGVY